MAYQLQYAIYNPGQYPSDVQANLDSMTAAGWRVNQALPAYNELYILWERETADVKPADVPDKGSSGHRRTTRKEEHLGVEAELSHPGG